MKLSFNNKGWMILTTLGVIATIFIYYFLIYVKNQETLMTKNGLRVINQIEHNFNDLKDGLLKSSKVASTHSGERNPLLHEMTDSDLTSRTKAEANDEVFFDENRLIFRVKTKGIENKQASDSESVKYFYIELSEIFQRDILRRDDVFDFIVIHDSKENTNLYTNNRLGNVRFDSILADSLSVYPVELGYDNYLVFTTKLSITQDVFLAGYINQGKFNSGKREVPLGLVILSTISAILFILCLPLIKLKVMSNVERLYISDVLFSGFSLVLIPAVLLLLSLGAASYFYQAKSSTEKELSDISKSISKSFEGELEKIVKQLETLKKRTQDENVNDLSDLAGFLEPLFEDKTTVIWDENFKMKLIGFRGVNSHSLFDDFNYFNGLFWTDSQGEVRSILALRDNSAISINLNHRKYISDVVKNDLVKFKDSEIVLESIRSVTDGSFEVGVGIKSGIESLPVLALSAPMRSTMYSIVKKGYGFCIVDRKGNTLFHSNIEKNLNENFYEETNLNFEGKEIDGAQNFYISKYNGKEQYIYSRQLDNLPDLRIITFADKQYIHTKYTITLYTTLLLYLVFLLLLGLIYSIFYLLNLRTTKLKQLVFPLNWLKPYDTEKHHLLYKYLFGLNGLGIFYLVVTTLLFQNQHEFLLNSLMLVSLILLFINFHYLTINLPVQKRIFSVYYTRDNNVFIPSFIFAGIILLAIIVNRANYWIDANSLFLWDFGMLIFGVAGALILKSYKRNQTPQVFNFLMSRFRRILQDRKAIFKGYKMYLLSWVVLFSIIPIMLIFSIIYSKESEIYYKQFIYNYHESEREWSSNKLNSYKDLLTNSNSSDYIEYIVLNDRDKHHLHVQVEPKDCNTRHDKDSITGFDKVYASIRMALNEYGKNTAGFVSPNQNKYWSYDRDSHCFKYSFDGQKPIHYANDPSVLGSWMRNGDVSPNWFVLIVLILILFISIGLITFVIHKLFGLDFKRVYHRLTYQGPDQFKDVFVGSNCKGLTLEGKETIIHRLLHSKNYSRPINSYNNTLIVGVNASHISIIKNELSCNVNRQYTFLIIDMYDIDGLSSSILSMENDPGAYLEKLLNTANNDKDDIKKLIETLYERSDKEHKFVIFIEHFEFAYNDHSLNQVKLKILERLVDHDSVAVNLSSEINPINIYDFYEQEIRKVEGMLDTKGEVSDVMLTLREQLSEFQVDYKKWLNLLGSFTKITLPLQLFETDDLESEEDDINTFNPKMSNLFTNETRNGNYMYNLKPYFDGLFKINQGDRDDYSSVHEDYILKIQEVSYSYYFSIWNSLSKEERYIVYDIAKDKFVNTNNVDGILDLLNKGILVYDHSLRLMNESFSNFILSKVNSDEALEKELEIRKEGTWGKASSILILIIVALIVFISFGQISILDDLNTLLGSLAAMFTLFLRIGGLGIKK